MSFLRMKTQLSVSRQQRSCFVMTDEKIKFLSTPDPEISDAAIYNGHPESHQH